MPGVSIAFEQVARFQDAVGRGLSIRAASAAAGISKDTGCKLFHGKKCNVSEDAGPPVMVGIPNEGPVFHQRNLVRRFIAICLHGNCWTTSQVIALVQSVWPDTAASAIGLMLARNRDGCFIKSGRDSWRVECIPRHLEGWGATLDEISDRIRDMRPELDEISRGRERERDSFYAARQRHAKLERSRESRRVAGLDEVVRKEVAISGDRVAELALSIAASISEKRVADFVGPAYEAVVNLLKQGISNESQIRELARKSCRVAESQERQPPWMRSLESMKESFGYEPSREMDEIAI